MDTFFASLSGYKTLLYNIGLSEQSCDNVLDLQSANITASLDRAVLFNSNYSDPNYVAMFKQDKAFCAEPLNDFYIQVWILL